ncbi:hypothetical protein Sviol_51340 [Streptomyces violascens]|uniref:Uncharacterized protein n=1 Tax=Streptomyces violascens TaxID=67381 RepID=A0ABQ3QTX8_9ACTN|nr:hypothetical protein Sviol_51340 [Streptomyces violascens]
MRALRTPSRHRHGRTPAPVPRTCPSQPHAEHILDGATDAGAEADAADWSERLAAPFPHAGQMTKETWADQAPRVPERPQTQSRDLALSAAKRLCTGGNPTRQTEQAAAHAGLPSAEWAGWGMLGDRGCGGSLSPAHMESAPGSRGLTSPGTLHIHDPAGRPGCPPAGSRGNAPRPLPYWSKWAQFVTFYACSSF